MLSVTNTTAEQIKLYCEQSGCKQPEKKLFITEKLLEAGDFIDAETLWLKIHAEQKTSLATVYLVLNWLISNGFATKRLSGKRTFVYRMN